MSSDSAKTHIEVESRSATGKNECRRIRAGGRVPGNVYGLNLAPYSISVDPRRVEEVLRLSTGRNTILRLALAGGAETRDVMLRELQRDPVTDQLIHIDFVRVDPEKAVTVSVPVNLVGTPFGVKNEGGIMDFVQRGVEVSCLPFAIPETLDVDVSELHLNQNVSVKDLQAGPGVTVLDDGDTILAVVAPTRAEVAEEAAAEGEEEAEGEEAAAEGEPEVAGKGKEAEGEGKPEESGK
jgi:large subunit ribosomal protein L25